MSGAALIAADSRADWIRRNVAELVKAYPGEWIAIRDGSEGILTHARAHQTLMNDIDDHQDVLIWRLPERYPWST